LIDRIDALKLYERDYIYSKIGVNNLHFNYEDMLFIIYSEKENPLSIRISWNGNDVEWENISYIRLRQILREKKIFQEK